MTGRCRAGCGSPLDASLIEHDGDGLHPSCVAPAAPVLPELERILARHQAGTQRSLQRRIGPSEIGVECDRQLGYRLFGPAHHKEEALRWAPLVGTWCHAGIAQALAEENTALRRERYLIERRVTVSEELGIAGTTDCYDLDTREVVDWKVVGKTRMQHYRRHGPGATYEVQAQLYGRGWDNAGADPRSVRVVFLPRWSHLISDGWEWAAPYNPAQADAALQRLARIGSLGRALGLSDAGGSWSVLAATVSDETCRYCPWRRAGGPADATGCPGNSAETYERAAESFGRGLV